MKYTKEASIFWNRPYGWRAGTRYVEPGASVVDVIRYEREELGNSLDVPDFLLSELAQTQIITNVPTFVLMHQVRISGYCYISLLLSFSLWRCFSATTVF